MIPKSHIPSLHQLQSHDAQELADQTLIPIVWTDHQVTRRQRIHGANIPGQETAYSSTHINEVLEHVALAGYAQAIFICETNRGKHLACYIEFHEIERHGTG